MLVEVIDERPANDETDDLLSSVLEQLVTHYAQPVHLPKEHSLPYFEVAIAEVPPVLQFCYDKIKQQSNNIDLLLLYPSRIRSTLFVKQQPTTISTTGISVLYHYEWLLSLLHDEESFSAPPSCQPYDAITEVLSTLLIDLTTSVQQAVENTHCKTYVIACLIRLIHACLRYCSNISVLPPELLRHCVVRLLAWATPYKRLGPAQVAPSLTEALSYQSLSKTPQKYSPISKSNPSSFAGLDWNTPLELSADAWCSPAATQAAKQCLALLSGNTSDHTMGCGRQACQQLHWTDVASTIRQHFFGKNDYSKEEDIENAVAVPTRLHLGRTVPEKAVEYDKPYQLVPTRLYSVCSFISLLENDVSSAAMIPELVPVLYELLAAPNETIQGMGAACLYHILHITGRQSSQIWSTMLVDNLHTALDLTIQTCRQGAVVAVLGATQTALLEFFDDDQEARRRRRKASQQRLMILQKNLHNAELVWGILAGAVIRLVSQHVRAEDDEALELGRLAMSCLLPLIRQDDGTVTATTVGLGADIQWLALVALSHWLVAAHAVMVHHEGKLLGSLLVCLGRTYEEISPTYVWARHAAAMVVLMTTCNQYGSADDALESVKLAEIIESRAYSQIVVDAANQILKEAHTISQVLKDAVNEFETK